MFWNQHPLAEPPGYVVASTEPRFIDQKQRKLFDVDDADLVFLLGVQQLYLTVVDCHHVLHNLYKQLVAKETGRRQAPSFKLGHHGIGHHEGSLVS